MSATAAAIPPFDPRAPRNLFYRAMVVFVRTRAGRAFGIRVASRVDPLLMRLTGGRLGVALVFPIAVLTTIGARSGEPRQAAVLYFNEGEGVILIASNWGRDKHPAWYHNLRANPEAVLQRGGRRARYIAEEILDEGQRQHLFALADLVYAGFADYREETAASGRRIPVMRLRARS